VATLPPQDDASEFELAIDDDLLAAAVAAVEARMEPPAPPPPDPEAEAAFAEDLEVELDGIELADDDPDYGDDDGELGIDLVVDEDEPTNAAGPPARDGTLDVLLAELTGSRTALAESETRADALEAELLETADALANETQERRRATAIAVRLKERAQRSDLLVTNARSGRAAAEKRIEELDAVISRMEAERDKLRERRRRELEDARQHGLAPTLKELIPVLDHLEMAVAHASAEPEKLVEGVRMIVGQFGRALETRGVARVDAGAGVGFDPERHEALQRVETTDHPAGTVLNELRAGYTLNGRLLRAARVTVAAAPPPPPAPVDPAPVDGAPTAPAGDDPVESPDDGVASSDTTPATPVDDDAATPAPQAGEPAPHAGDDAPEPDGEDAPLADTGPAEDAAVDAAVDAAADPSPAADAGGPATADADGTAPGDPAPADPAPVESA
jgi:molecular chaperone GrpE